MTDLTGNEMVFRTPISSSSRGDEQIGNAGTIQLHLGKAFSESADEIQKQFVSNTTYTVT